MKRLLYWAPRILSLLFVAFLSVFALDVFESGVTFEVLMAFVIHLIPSFVLLIGTVVAWRRDLVGTAMFLGFALAYVLQAGFDKPWSWYAFIAAPSLIIALLFALNWRVTHVHSSSEEQLR